ncbi:jg639, partial [Pararge aegeria aegeria]
LGGQGEQVFQDVELSRVQLVAGNVRYYRLHPALVDDVTARAPDVRAQKSLQGRCCLKKDNYEKKRYVKQQNS